MGKIIYILTHDLKIILTSSDNAVLWSNTLGTYQDFASADLARAVFND